jgi:TetR/AcrR family transcriptional regulator, cholesterol catabolism regulator
MDGTATTPPLGRRERNRMRVKENLYTAAVDLVARKGYDETSIDEIAERADVARATFFNYFHRKEDLISEWGDRRRAALMVSLEAASSYGAGPVEQLVQCMDVLAELNEEERALTVAMLPAWVRAGRPIVEVPHLAHVFAAIVQQGLDEGELQSDLSAERLGTVLRDIYFGALYRWVDNGADGGNLAGELQQILRLLLDGLTPRAAA